MKNEKLIIPKNGIILHDNDTKTIYGGMSDNEFIISLGTVVGVFLLLSSICFARAYYSYKKNRSGYYLMSENIKEGIKHNNSIKYIKYTKI